MMEGSLQGLPPHIHVDHSGHDHDYDYDDVQFVPFKSVTCQIKQYCP